MKNFLDISHNQQIARWENVLRVLQALTPHQRRRHWDMEIFGKKTDCGTVGCAVGHCSLDPWFRRRGLRGTFKHEFETDAFTGKSYTTSELVFEGTMDWMGHQVPRFFGPTEDPNSNDQIFMNDSPRSVAKVIREVKARIKDIRKNPPPSAKDRA